MDTLKALLETGGPTMPVLLACSLVAWGVILDRLLFWASDRRHREVPLREQVLELTEKGRPAEGLELSRGSRDTTLRVVTSGLAHRDWDPLEAMEIHARKEIETMDRGLGLLETMVIIAPLLGLLGTVLGLIESFDVLGAGALAKDPQAVIAGLGEALISTAAGLVVAIAAVLPATFFRWCTRRRALTLELMISRVDVSLRHAQES